MKSILFVLAGVFTLSVVTVGCGKKGGADAKVSDSLAAASKGDQEVKLASGSKVKWYGRKGAAGFKLGEHFGSVNIKDGSLSLKDGKLAGGKIELDMASITVEDLKDDAAGKGALEGHLRGTAKPEQEDHFFNTKKFPTATFEITGVNPTKGDSASVAGNLTLKGITKNITFPALIKYNDGGKAVSAKAKFDIKREDFNIKYGADKSLGDKFIHENFTVEFDLASDK